MKIYSVSLQCSSVHEKQAILSRFYTKTNRNWDIPPYYPNPKEIERSEWTPYHFWELIDDIRDHHLQKAGAFVESDFNFHLYPRYFSAAIFEQIDPLKPALNLYAGDDCVPLSLERQNSKYWFTPSNAYEASLLPFEVEIWYTDHKIQLELFINWDVYAIKGTTSNHELQNQLLKLVHAGWELDEKASDLWISTEDIKHIKSVNSKDNLNTKSYIFNGFFEPEPIVNMM